MGKTATVCSLLFFMTLIQMSVDIYLPSTLVIANELHTSIANVQLTFFAFLITSGLSQLLYGPLMDRFGRKPCMVFGAMIFFATSIMAALTPSITLLIIARTFQGIGAGVFSVGSRATMRDILTHDEFKKTAIYQGMTWSLVPILAPVIGSYVQHYFGWRYNFGILAIAGLISVLLTCKLTESLKQRADNIHLWQILKSYGGVVSHAQFWPFMVGTVSDSILLAAFYIFAPILLQGNLGVSVIQYGWIMFYIALAALVAMALNRIMINRVPDRYMMMTSLLLCIGSGIAIITGCILGTHLIGWFMAAMMMMQFGMSWLFPLCISYAMRPMQLQAGKAAAVIGCGNLTSSGLASLIIAYIVVRNEWIFGGLYVVVSIVLLLIFARFKWPK